MGGKRASGKRARAQLRARFKSEARAFQQHQRKKVGQGQRAAALAGRGGVTKAGARAGAHAHGAGAARGAAAFAVDGAAAAASASPQGRGLRSLRASHRVLEVGAGNFSFATALARRLAAQAQDAQGARARGAEDPGSEDEAEAAASEDTDAPAPSAPAANLVATSYDGEEELLRKYGDACDAVTELCLLGGCALHGVDAGELRKSLGRAAKAARGAGQPLPPFSAQGPFDHVVFLFPHHGAGIKSELHSVRASRELLLRFFASVGEVLEAGGAVHVAVKTGAPYDKWEVTKLAQNCGWRAVCGERFDPAAWPGYAHRRTLGFLEGKSAKENEEIAKGARVYTFERVG